MKQRLSIILILVLLLSFASSAMADQDQGQDQGQNQGQSQIMAPNINAGSSSSSSAGANSNSSVTTANTNNVDASNKNDVASTSSTSSNVSITQNSEATTMRVSHPAQLFQTGMPQIFGPQSLPGNANNSFLRMMQIFPIIIEENTGETVKEEGDSGKTDIIFYYYPGQKGKGKNFFTKVETKTLLKGKYSPLGFLSITAQKGKLEFPFLLDDALKFLLNDAKFKMKGVPIVAYIDPFGVSANMGNEGRSRGFSILGGGATLQKNGDMSFGGGIGWGGGEIFPSAIVGMKIWVLVEDPSAAEIELLTTMQPTKIGVAEIETSIPAKAKGAGVVNNNN